MIDDCECEQCGQDAGCVGSLDRISGSIVPATRLASSGVYPPVCSSACAKAATNGHRPLTGEKLGVRDSGSVKQVCYFGQISPPKDVSICLPRRGRWTDYPENQLS
jgi:hypothetical protein